MAAALGVMLSEGLNDIDTAGLLRRDLKPGDVFLGADGPWVIDFGLVGSQAKKGRACTVEKLAFRSSNSGSGTAADVWSKEPKQPNGRDFHE